MWDYGKIDVGEIVSTGSERNYDLVQVGKIVLQFPQRKDVAARI